MPLIKNLNVDPDLYADSIRRREFVVSADFVRRIEMNKEVSIRTASMKSSVLIETLRKVCEDDVKVTNEILESYANAEDWLCQRMSALFKTVRGMGYNPSSFAEVASFFQEPKSCVLYKGSDLVWVPVYAFYVGDERVYLFRVMNLNLANRGELMNLSSSPCIGYTKECLRHVSPELSAYMTKLENKAMEDEKVLNAFTTLGAALRPKQYKEEVLAERAKAYSNVSDFGGWA